jgi:AraC-like DNA-binding protein
MKGDLSLPWQAAYDLIEPLISADGIHRYQFEPMSSVDVRYLSFARQADIRSNRHDYCELLYAYSGEVVYQVQDRAIKLEEGSLFVMGSTLMHRIIDLKRGHFQAVALYFDPTILRGSCSQCQALEYLMPFQVQGPDFPHVVDKHTGIPHDVFSLMRKIHAASPPQDSFALLSVETYLKMILVLLMNHYIRFRGSESIFQSQSTNLQRMRPVFRFVDEHYSHPISVTDAAALVHMSKSTFTRFFKHVTGQSFVAYLNRFRVAKARYLLETTEKSIAEIGQESGFCDQSYFGVMFHRFIGLTPREFRQNGRHKVQRYEIVPLLDAVETRIDW